MRCHFELAANLPWVYVNLTRMSLRFHVDFTSASLRFHSDFTLISLRFHFGLTSFDFDFTTMSLRCHFGFTSISPRFHFELTSIPPRSHCDGFLNSLRFQLDWLGFTWIQQVTQGKTIGFQGQMKKGSGEPAFLCDSRQVSRTRARTQAQRDTE